MAKLGRRLFAGFAFVAGMAGYYGWRLIGQVDAAQISAGGPRTDMRAWDIDFVSIEGEALPLKNFQGKALLVVNTASLCGFTPQYKELEKIWAEYKDKGLVVLGFPANEFGAQEPGTDAEIATFCSSKYGVTFDMFSKIVVKGAGKAPLYQALIESADPKGEVGWNFEKFLIGRDGKVVGRYKSGVAPDDATLKATIEAALAKAG